MNNFNAKVTACPLDCYDACEIVYEQGIKASKSGHTAGFLCPHMNHYEKHQQILLPRYKGKEISMQEALAKLKEIFDANLKSEIVHYRGSGNFALMQEVTDYVMGQMGATLTNGSLCDGAGEAGIIEGRGSNKNMPLLEIEKSEVVIFWGRNPHTTSSHLLPLMKGKTIIVIDPVKTKIAKMAHLHLQIKPHTDIYLAMLLYRFLHINGSVDEEYLEEVASEYEEFYELTQGIRIKATLENIGVSLGDIGDILAYTEDKKVAIVCGVGVQKYRDGADIMRAIDAFALALGVFAKEGSGVAYLGNSKEAIDSPFKVKAKRVSKVNTPFEEFKTVFIQGANPLAQMPDTNRVENSLQHAENIIYFGLWENETSEIADLVIPAKSFLHKDDIRSSYSHNGLLVMNKQLQSSVGISEYELAAFLAKEYDLELKEEKEYLEYFKNFGVQKIDGSFEVENRETNPYKDGFDTDDGEFVFLEEFETQQNNAEGAFYLITPKSAKSLNSQFFRNEFIYLNPTLGYKEDEELVVESENGKITLRVRNNNDIREDCVVIYSGTKGVNRLTSSQHSYEGKSAVYQENRVKLSRK